MKKISCAERIFRSAQDLYKKRAAAGFNPAAAFMRSRLSEINQRLTAGSTGGVVSSSAGTSGTVALFMPQSGQISSALAPLHAT